MPPAFTLANQLMNHLTNILAMITLGILMHLARKLKCIQKQI